MARTEGFTFIDLFAGIGGFHLAMEQLGGRCVMASEIDAACREVYQQRFKDTPVVGDIRDVTRDAKRDVPAHDVLCAGFPCQPFSKSGFQHGLRDQTRGTLFFEIMEIVRAHHPRFLILENVRNLAGPRHADTWQIIVRSLRAEGYRVADSPVVFSPHLLTPEEGGRPQVRERVFILAEHVGASADLIGHGLVENAPPSGAPINWHIEDWLLPDEEIPHVERYRLRDFEKQWLAAWQDFIEIVDEEPLPGFPIWADAFVPHPEVTSDTPRWKANFLRKNSSLYLAHQHSLDDWMQRHGVADFPASRRKFEWQARGFDRDLSKLVLHFRPSGIRVKGPTYLPALVAITQTSVIGSRQRRITPREAARLQGVPDDYRMHEIDTVAYKQLGNGVNVGAAVHVARALFDSSAAGWPSAKRLVS